MPTAVPSAAPSLLPSPGDPSSSRPRSAGDETVCPGGAQVAGVDVSSYNADTSWGDVQGGGREFAFVKATEGVDFINPDFSTDWPGVRNAGLIRGAYHFFHPSEDPVQQADHFLMTVGNFAVDDLPAMLDWEVTDGVSSEVDIRNAKAWLERVEKATGKTPIIYVNPAFWKSLGSPAGFERYPLFIANYSVDCPTVPAPWSNWMFWQWGLGTVPGVSSGEVDVDAFNGSFSQLQEFAISGSVRGSRLP